MYDEDWHVFMGRNGRCFVAAREIADEIKRIRAQLPGQSETRHLLDVAMLALGDAVLRKLDG